MVHSELNRKQRQNVNKGWMVVVIPEQQTHGLLPVSSSRGNVERKNLINVPAPLANGLPDDLAVQSTIQNTPRPRQKSLMQRVHAYVRRRTLMETVKHEQEAKHVVNTLNSVAEHRRLESDATDIADEHSRGNLYFPRFIILWTESEKRFIIEPYSHRRGSTIFLNQCVI